MTMSDLINTIEDLRASKHKNLDPQLVREVVAAQEDFMANSNEAYKRIAQAVEEYLVRKENLRC